MRVLSWSWGVAAWALLLGACKEETAPEALAGGSITVDTLESGRILIRTPDEPVWPAGEGWELRERFRVGAADGDGPDVFSGMVQVAMGPGGELFVLDLTVQEVLAFGPAGDHLFTLWRRGQGPGELSMPTGLTVDFQGVLWVLDPTRREASWWGRAAPTASIASSPRETPPSPSRSFGLRFR